MQFSVIIIVIFIALPHCYGLTADNLIEQCFHQWYRFRQGTKITDYQEKCLRLKVFDSPNSFFA